MTEFYTESEEFAMDYADEGGYINGLGVQVVDADCEVYCPWCGKTLLYLDLEREDEPEYEIREFSKTLGDECPHCHHELWDDPTDAEIADYMRGAK